jgi:hypothetical protein
MLILVTATISLGPALLQNTALNNVGVRRVDASYAGAIFAAAALTSRMSMRPCFFFTSATSDFAAVGRQHRKILPRCPAYPGGLRREFEDSNR